MERGRKNYVETRKKGKKIASKGGWNQMVRDSGKRSFRSARMERWGEPEEPTTGNKKKKV